jgi:hypothetical protein
VSTVIVLRADVPGRFAAGVEGLGVIGEEDME